MLDTKKFRTRQEFKNCPNPKGKDYVIGLDIGYSSVKVFYENGRFCFPSYVRKLSRGMLNIADDKDILYKEEGSNDVYMIGYNAQSMAEDDNTNDSEGELYSRNRYKDARFKIICNAALGLSVMNKRDDRKIFIETGLPSSYVEGDSKSLIKVLTKPAEFSLKIGGGDWKKFSIAIEEENIHIMPQPSGSLYSVLIKPDGRYIDNAKNMLSSNVLVMDAGFGTFDFFGIMNREIKCKESTDELGMRQVLDQTSKNIFKDTTEDIRITALQKHLESGSFDYTNEDDMQSETCSIEPYLSKANSDILKQAMDKAKSVTNSFRGYKYIIITGGTGAAWFEDIKEWLSGMKTIEVIPGNQNDHLPLIYSNARGYYLFRCMLNKR